MILRDALNEGRQRLEQNGIPTPFLDALLLLGHILGVPKEVVLASYPENLEERVVSAYRALIEHRLQGVPVSYIRGVKEFYGREYLVDKRVLVPRPDTEILIDSVLDLVRDRPEIRRLHDTCTGTGCIAITLKLERPSLEISASDISEEAGEVFTQNSRHLGVSLPFYKSDLLSSVPGKYDCITANPPYLKEAEYESMRKANWPEPRASLVAGETGLDILKRLIKESVESLAPNGYLVCEAAPAQFSELKSLMLSAGFKNISVRNDLAGRERVIMGQL